MPADHAKLLAINNGATPHVSALDVGRLTWLVREPDYARVAERDGHVAGFVLAMRYGTPYWSANYAWFRARYEAFVTSTVP